MARKIRNPALDSRAARAKLKPGLYYAPIERSLHLGYRKTPAKGKSGVWELRSYVGDQKYRREKIGIADDINDADGANILDYWQAFDRARQRLKENAALKAAPLTVGQVLDDYLEYVAAEKKDFGNSKGRCDLIRTAFGHREAASLTKAEIEKWFRKLATTPARKRSSKNPKKGGQKYKALDTEEAKRRRRSSANRILTVLKAALNRAYHDEKLPSDKPWKTVKPFRSADAARVRYLTVSECKRLVNAADEQFRPLVQAALMTGCRYGELVRLAVSDYHPARGKAPATVAIRESKSGQPRHVYLNDEGAAFFARLCAGRAGDQHMLRRGDRPWHSAEQSRPMRETCERAKITPAANFHALRHTYASLAIMNGTPMLVVAQNLGHTDTRMVEKHYGHLARDYVAEQIRAGVPTFGFAPDKKVVGIEA